MKAKEYERQKSINLISEERDEIKKLGKVLDRENSFPVSIRLETYLRCRTQFNKRSCCYSTNDKKEYRNWNP